MPSVTPVSMTPDASQQSATDPLEQKLQEKRQAESNWFINVVLGIGIVGIGIIASFFILSGGKLSLNSFGPSPTPIVVSTSIISEYANPFDQKTQYANPFAETTNPFDGFAQ